MKVLVDVGLVLLVFGVGVGGALLVYVVGRAAARRRARERDASLAAVRGLAKLAANARNSEPMLARRAPFGGSGADLAASARRVTPFTSQPRSAPTTEQDTP